MGPLALPATGLVYLDANGLIYTVERVADGERLRRIVRGAFSLAGER